jgi:hypothetical protein
LINDDDPANRLRSIAVLASFPELIARLEHPALTALHHTVSDDALLASAPQAFAAVEIDEFRDELVARFEALDDTVAARVLTVTAPSSLWPNALARYACSGSFRGAEAGFEQFIAPFRPIIGPAHLDELFAAVVENGQIWDAALTKRQLADLLKSVDPHRPSSAAIDRLYNRLPSVMLNSFADTWKILEQRGWQQPLAEGLDA